MESNYDVDVPIFIKETTWVASVELVYRHPATKIVVHHGGGARQAEAVEGRLLNLTQVTRSTKWYTTD